MWGVSVDQFFWDLRKSIKVYTVTTCNHSLYGTGTPRDAVS